MDLVRRLHPLDSVTAQQTNDGLRAIVWDGICSQAMGTLTSGIFLVGFAVSLGASNAVIGLLGALPFLLNLLQVPTVLLVERLRMRKAIVVFSGALGRTALIALACIPFFSTQYGRLGLLLAGVTVYGACSSISGCAWSSWMRDLVPENRLGRYFANRLFLATVVAAIISLGAGFAVDTWKRWWADSAAWIYSLLFATGGFAGLAGLYFLSITPEPRMPLQRTSVSILRVLAQPFRDVNFRRLLLCLGSWNFAVNLAAPFFTVYMLKRLGYGMSFVASVTVISQVTNLIFIRSIGELCDRFGNKAVLSIFSPLFILCIFAWTFTTLPDRHAGTVPLLIAIHGLMGLATAGVTLASSNIGLKLAPRGEATSYLASLGLVNSACAGIAPILGGLLSEFFAARELSVAINWTGPTGRIALEALNFQQWDFFFLFAALIGLYSIHRLSLVREAGEVEERRVVDALLLEARRSIKNLSTVGGLRGLTVFPFAMLPRVMQSGERRAKKAPDTGSRDASARAAPQN